MELFDLVNHPDVMDLAMEILLCDEMRLHPNYRIDAQVNV